MIDRWITPEDHPILESSLKNYQYNKTTSPEFFYEKGTFCKIYEDEKGPIFFLRGAKAIRVDIEFCDNYDYKRNGKALLKGFPAFVENCKKAGFKEICFNTQSPFLKKFWERAGFEKVEGDELRYFIKD